MLPSSESPETREVVGYFAPASVSIWCGEPSEAIELRSPHHASTRAHTRRRYEVPGGSQGRDASLPIQVSKFGFKNVRGDSGTMETDLGRKNIEEENTNVNNQAVRYI